jgi:1-acyl-sn-glycerol-3-phosphate acyltransferase
MWRHPIRVTLRFFRFFGGLLLAWVESLKAPPETASGSFEWRAAWLRRHCANAVRNIDLEIVCQTPMPAGDMVVSNHLGYLDIVVLATQGKMALVSKAEVRNWPLLGALAAAGGTVFIRRDRRGDVAAAAAAMKSRTQSGVPVAVFPEGTSSGGDRVLPFHSSLLEPAAAGKWTIIPAAVVYQLDDGDPSEEVCYWKDMTFFPHLLNLLSKRRIRAHVEFGEPLVAASDRKQLAVRLHDEVSRIHKRLRDAANH